MSYPRTEATKDPANRPSGQRVRKLRYFMFVIVVCVALAYLASLAGGQGTRGRFDPYSLKAKQQAELLLPYLAVPVYRSGWSPAEDYALVEFLVEHGYWTPSTHEARWLPMYRWNVQWRDGQTTLYSKLAMHTNHWIKFTEERPAVAAVVWPDVLEALRSADQPGYHAQLRLACAEQSETPEAYRALLEQELQEATNDRR